MGKIIKNTLCISKPHIIFFFFFVFFSHVNIAIDSTNSVQSALHILDLFDKSLSSLLQENQRNIPVGTLIYNVELKPQAGGRIARSAGNYAEIVAHDAGYALVKMPSTEVRRIIDTAWASIGEVSNDEHHLQNDGKAGKSRWLGIRPTVRGTAMNPVDHPHGGGEGRQGRGRRRAISVYGKPTGKGQKSRRAKKYSNVLIVSRRKVGKKR